MKRLCVSTIALLCCLVLLGGAFSIAYAAGGMSVFVFMDNYCAGEPVTIMWYNNVDGAAYYDCTVLNQTTQKYPRRRATSSSGYDCYISGSLITAGSYKVWVGAVAADGTVLDDGYAYFTVTDSSCDHKWNSKTGECKLCDEACPHNNGFYEVETSCTGTSVSDKQHKLVWEYDKECKVCRYVVSSGETREETGKHQFDSNGDCTLCDYRASCKHIKTKLEEISTTHSQCDERYHYVKVVSNIVCANTNCGKLIEYGGDISSTKELHTMENDRCILCEYSVKYDPVSVSIVRGQASAYVGEMITASCSSSGGTGRYWYYWYVYCDGAEVYSTSSWDTHASYTANKAGNYTFTVRIEDRDNGETATASTSAIKVTTPVCQHANSTTTASGEVSYKKLSDSKHTVLTEYQNVCKDCGKTLSTWIEQSTEAHNYSAAGNCVDCGAAKPNEKCQHEQMKSKEISRTYRATASEKKHLVIITFEDRCANSSCNMVLNQTRTETEYEEHTFWNNVCQDCEYAKKNEQGCDHADRKKDFLYSSVEPYDATFHIVISTYKVTCTECKLVIQSAYEEEEYVPHTMGSSSCEKCGYKSKCNHGDLEKEGIDTVFNPYDADQHVVTTTYKRICVNCREVVDTNYKEDAYFDHTIENGKCKYCSYVVKVQDEVCKVYGNEHVHDYTGYESAHETELDYPGSHNIFKRCKCGHVIYTGETKTTLAENVCCFCGNHQYGAEYTEGSYIMRKCRNCSDTKRVGIAEVDCSVTGLHSYTQITYAKAHPHQAIEAKCKCGAVTNDISVENGVSMDCCGCGYHEWIISRIDGTKCYMRCWRCQVQQVTEATAEQLLSDRFTQYEAAILGNDPFSTVGAKAIEKLTDEVFVYTNETVNATSDISGSLIGLFETKQDYDETIISEWEYLITQMLVRNPEYGYENEETQLKSVTQANLIKENAHEFKSRYDWLSDVGVINSTDDWVNIYDNALESMAKEANVLYAAIKDGTATEEQIQMFNKLDAQQLEMKATRNKFEQIGDLAEVTMLAIDGISAWGNVAQVQSDYIAMGTYYNANVAKLESIIAAAETVGSREVATAARSVKANLDEQMRKTAEELQKQYFGDKAWAAGTSVVKNVATDVLGELLENAAPPLKYIELIGQTADLALQWGDSYESAKQMMLLRDMDNALGDNVHRALALDTEEAYYFSELFHILQIEGLNQTKQFLVDYEAGTGLSVSEFGIYDLDEYLRKIDTSIDSRISQKEYMYVLHGKALQETTSKQCYIISSGARCRSSADTTSSVVIELPGGTAVEVQSSLTDAKGRTWYQIECGGKTGWVQSGVVEFR